MQKMTTKSKIEVSGSKDQRLSRAVCPAIQRDLDPLVPLQPPGNSQTGAPCSQVNASWANAMKWFTALMVGVLGFAIAWAVLPVREWLQEAVDHIASLGPWGIFVYFALYYCLACATFPTTPLSIGAGILFHFSIAFAIAWCAGALASVTTFMFARHVAADWCNRKLNSLPRCKGLLATVETQGFKIVLLSRLNPLIPASVKNYGFGLTAIEFWKYAAGTWLGQFPIVSAHVYLGWAGSATILGSESHNSWHLTFLVVGVVMSVATLLLVNWYGRRKLLGIRQ